MTDYETVRAVSVGSTNAERKAAAEKRFQDALAEQGAVLLEPYKNANYRHLIRCSEGHEVRKAPNAIQQGAKSVCNACSKRNSKYAFQSFIENVESQGGLVLEDKWLGNHTPHRVQCSEGHVTTTDPANVAQGHSICRMCSFRYPTRTWDMLYVVENADKKDIKFGISSGDGTARLRCHWRDGYTEVIRSISNLGEGVALEIETAIKNTLRLAGEVPSWGNEHFHSSALAIILGVVDNHPAVKKVMSNG